MRTHLYECVLADFFILHKQVAKVNAKFLGIAIFSLLFCEKDCSVLRSPAAGRFFQNFGGNFSEVLEIFFSVCYNVCNYALFCPFFVERCQKRRCQEVTDGKL